jgi:hypothetical protein
VEIFVLANLVGDDDGARAIGANEMMMMRPLRRRRWTAISYGVIDYRSENLQHLQRGRLLSLAQRCGGCNTERPSEFRRVSATTVTSERNRGRTYGPRMQNRSIWRDALPNGPLVRVAALSAAVRNDAFPNGPSVGVTCPVGHHQTVIFGFSKCQVGGCETDRGHDQDEQSVVHENLLIVVPIDDRSASTIDC